MNNNDNKELVTKMEYKKKLAKFERMRKELLNVSKAKIKAAENDPGNTWHDKFAYEQLDLQEQALFSQLENLQKSINNCKIIEKRNNNDNKVDIYDNLKLLFIYSDDEEEQLTLTLGGDKEECISLNSPLGRAIYNKEYQTKVDYWVNKQKISVYILGKVN